MLQKSVQFLFYTVLIAVFVLLTGIGGMNDAPKHNSLPACATEDSDNCYWDASARGNGHGHSFQVIDGKVTYLYR